jgi:hypothetical protein
LVQTNQTFVSLLIKQIEKILTTSVVPKFADIMFSAISGHGDQFSGQLYYHEEEKNGSGESVDEPVDPLQI